jgi:CelD/BcsL family acetyltransferase involved in cellulose biosynthesis
VTEQNASLLQGAQAVVRMTRIDDPQWLALLQRARPTLFQTPRWCNLVSAEYGFPARLALVVSGTDAICGLPYAEVEDFRGERRIAYAFSDFCEPLGDINGWPLIEAALCRGSVPWQIRSRVVPSSLAETAEQPGVQQSVALPKTMEEASSAFHQKQRVNTARFERVGGTLRKVADRSFLDPFYNLFATLRKRKFRLLPQGRNFFGRVIDEYFPDRGFGLLAELNGTVVAAMILLSESDTLYVKYSASDPDVLNVRPNNFLFQKAIEQAILGGFNHLDLGISIEPGLQRFKEHLGAKSIAYYAARYVQKAKTDAIRQQEACLANLTRILTADEVPLASVAEAGAELYRYFV